MRHKNPIDGQAEPPAARCRAMSTGWGINAFLSHLAIEERVSASTQKQGAGGLVKPLQRHLQGVRGMHQADLAAGWGKLELPQALERKYRNAAREWAWLRAAVQAAAISKPAICNSLRYFMC